MKTWQATVTIVFQTEDDVTDEDAIEELDNRLSDGISGYDLDDLQEKE